MFEIVNNRQVIFGENKISEIPGLLKWYEMVRVQEGIFCRLQQQRGQLHKDSPGID